jgi:hypothetical protein
MAMLAWTGYRRWLSRPWQWSLRDYMIVVAVCAVGLVLAGYPILIIVFFTTVAGAIYVCLRLANHGFKLADVVMLLAMIFLTAAFMLPTMERTRGRTLGKQFFRSFIPARCIALFSGS